MSRLLLIVGLASIASAFIEHIVDDRSWQNLICNVPNMTAHRSMDHSVIASQEGAKRPFTRGQRVVAVSLFVILFPVISVPLANRVLDRKSNTGNLLLLFGYTGLDMLVVHVVGDFSIGGILSAIAYMIGLLTVFTYNLWICAFLAGLRR